MDEDVFTVDEVDELGAHTVAASELAFFYGDSVFVPLLKEGASGFLCFDFAGACVGVSFFGAHSPPVGVVGLSVECAFACEGDVFGSVCVDEGLVVVAVHAFPSCADIGVFVGVGGEEECGAFFEVEVDVVFESDGACEPFAFGDDDSTAALLGAEGDDAVDELGVEVAFGFRFFAVVEEAEVFVGEGWGFDLAFYPWIDVAPCFFGGGGAPGECEAEGQGHHHEFFHGVG